VRFFLCGDTRQSLIREQQVVALWQRARRDDERCAAWLAWRTWYGMKVQVAPLAPLPPSLTNAFQPACSAAASTASPSSSSRRPVARTLTSALATKCCCSRRASAWSTNQGSGLARFALWSRPKNDTAHTFWHSGFCAVFTPFTWLGILSPYVLNILTNQKLTARVFL